jgi:hypothetical protein
MPPTFMFVIDVSHAAVSSGMLSVACATIKDSLDALPGEERTLVGILTFDRCVCGVCVHSYVYMFVCVPVYLCVCRAETVGSS